MRVIILLLLFQWALPFAPPLQKTRLHYSQSSFLRSVQESVVKKSEEPPLADGLVEAPFLSTAPKTLIGKSIPYSELTIGVMKETADGESRVSLTPSAVAALVKEGFQVLVQTGGKCARYLQRSEHFLMKRYEPQLGARHPSVIRHMLMLGRLLFRKKSSSFPRPISSQKFSRQQWKKYPS
jgi:Alanine dehydrogenase/PNT, N-terminal domain